MYKEYKNAEYFRSYQKARLKTPKGKIYNRVAAYNKANPGKITVTPLEAVEMYEATGWVPTFVKHDDLLQNNEEK